MPLLLLTKFTSRSLDLLRGRGDLVQSRGIFTQRLAGVSDFDLAINFTRFTPSHVIITRLQFNYCVSLTSSFILSGPFSAIFYLTIPQYP